MIRVTVGNSAGTKKTVEVSPDQSLKKTLDDAGIQYGKGSVHLNGETVQQTDLNVTFAQKLGPWAEECSLIVVVKGDAA